MKTNNSFLGLSLSLLTLTVLVAACAASTSTPSDSSGTGGGGSGATPTPTPTPKAIANEWTAQVGAAVVLDLRNAVLDGSTTFSAPFNGYGGAICTYTLKMGPTSGVSGNCVVVGSPVLTAAGNSAFFGNAGVDCTSNAYNICDGAGGHTNEYNWNGSALSFPNQSGVYE